MAYALQWPKGLRPMENQVAGHTFELETESIGLFQDDSTGCVLKPLGKPECREREVNFYNEVYDAKADPLVAKAKHFIPEFYEVVHLKVNKRDYVFIKLEDLTYGMRWPCIMDIKVGKRTWDPEASEEKKAVEEVKYAACKHIIGLCIPGFQVYKRASGAAGDGVELLRHSKEYGKNLLAKDFPATMELFFNTKPTKCLELLQEVLTQLHAIHQWFRSQRLYHFYASSLLIAYDFDKLEKHLQMSKVPNGHAENGIERAKHPIHILPKCSSKDWVKVRMIDFAHVFKPQEGPTPDTNYLFGLENLIQILEDILVSD